MRSDKLAVILLSRRFLSLVSRTPPNIPQQQLNQMAGSTDLHDGRVFLKALRTVYDEVLRNLSTSVFELTIYLNNNLVDFINASNLGWTFVCHYYIIYLPS